MKKSKDALSKPLSVYALVRKVGMDRRTIMRRLAGAPKTKDGKYDYAVVAPLLRTDEKVGVDLRRSLIDEQIRKLKIANDAKDRLLIPRAIVAKAMAECASACRSLLYQRLENEYPMAVAGLDVPAARVYGKRLADSLLREIQAMAALFPE